MLSEEKIKEISEQMPDGFLWSEGCGWETGILIQEAIDFTRAIEATVLPEGWVAVPRIVTPAIEAVYRNDSGAYGTAQELHDAMIAAAPKAQECSCQQGQMCLVCDPDLMPAQAEKQGPVNDEPVAWMVVTPDDKLIFQNASQAEHYAEKWELVSAPLYTRPQPDLTAEVERLEKCLRYEKMNTEVWQMDAESKLVERTEAYHRIAALEKSAREARDADEAGALRFAKKWNIAMPNA